MTVGRRVALSLLVACVFASAAVLMAVQPMVTMILLPSTGGSPRLWHAFQCLFQALLFLGYLVSARTSTKRLAGLLIVGSLASLMMPSLLDLTSSTTLLTPMQAGTNVLASVGVLFVLLSCTTLAVQLVLSRDSVASDSFWLYAASNVGSLAGVLAYPIVVQPLVGVHFQYSIWIWVTRVLLLVIGSVLWFSRPSRPDAEKIFSDSTSVSRVPVGRQFGWYARAIVPVGLSLSWTTYLATDLGSHPFVWLAPFSAYLATLALAFTERGRATLSRLAPLSVCLGFLLVLDLTMKLSWPIPSVRYAFQLLAVGALLASSQERLANSRPTRSDSIPLFYCWTILGGISASAFLSFGARYLLDPRIYGEPGGLVQRVFFASPAPELLLWAVVALVAAAGSKGQKHDAEWSAVAALTAGILIVVVWVKGSSVWRFLDGIQPWFGLAVPMLVTIGIAMLLRRPVSRLVAVLSLLAALGFALPYREGIVEQSRSDFDILRIEDKGLDRLLVHGSTVHGRQATVCTSGRDLEACHVPLGYYGLGGPLSIMFSAIRPIGQPLAIGVVGLEGIS